MSDLERQLRLKKRELDIVLAIDRVRDSGTGPTAMLSGIVSIVADQFDVDLGLLYLINRDSKALELKALHEHKKGWEQLQSALLEDVAHRAMYADGVVVWTAKDVLPDDMLTRVPSTLQIAIVPIYMETRDMPLGLLMLTRADLPFDDDDVQLLRTAESQIDSAVIQAYMHFELAQRNKELETIYRFDHIRDRHLPFDDMLDVVLQELCKVIDAEMGFVMLYNQEGERLEMRAITDEDLLRNSHYYQLINELANEAMVRAELVCHSEGNSTRCTVILVPLILQDAIIGVFGAVNRDPKRNFTSDDQRLLKAIVSQMDTAILEGMERRKLRRVLGRAVDPHVLERLLMNPNVDILEGERSLITVLYADIRGSTNLAERLEPEVLVNFINDYLGAMTEVLLSQEGTLDKFVGDEVMALFNAPLPQPDHALRAVRVGLGMQAEQQKLLEKWADHDVGAGVGVGIATGDLIVGEMGCERRTDYTVIGRAANLGARICSAAKSGEVLISEATYQLVKDLVEVTPISGMHFKGIDHAMTVYRVERVL